MTYDSVQKFNSVENYILPNAADPEKAGVIL